MKKIVCFLITLSFAWSVQAQKKNLLVDMEKLFSKEETAYLDSVLIDYYSRTGNHIGVVSTDTLDIPFKQFVTRFVQQMGVDKPDNKYGMVLFLSRKQSMINIEVNINLQKFSSDSLLMSFISAGLPDLKEKKTAAGVWMICKAGMRFMDSLSARKP